MKITLSVILLITLAGCAEFPQAEARNKARLLREKGYYFEAERLEDDAIYLPKHRLSLDGDWKSEYAPENDIYHFPELRVPGKKRNYDIHYLTGPDYQ